MLRAPVRSAGGASGSVANRFDVGQAAVLADRGRTSPAELDAVVLRRIVGGGEHRTGQIERSRRVVEEVGRTETDVDHVEALGLHARGKGIHQLGPRRSHVSSDDDGGGAAIHATKKRGEADAEGAAHFRIELIRVDAPDVVGLHDVVENGGRTGGRGANGCWRVVHSSTILRWSVAIGTMADRPIARFELTGNGGRS